MLTDVDTVTAPRPPRRRHRAALGGLLVVALLAAQTGAAHTGAAQARLAGDHERAVTATNGQQMAANPVLGEGQRATLTAVGFAPHAQVTVGLVGVRLLDTVEADRRGAAVYILTVPTSLGAGQHALIFSGAARRLSAQSRGTLAVTAPRNENWLFRTSGELASRSRSHGIAGKHESHRPGETARTGFNALLVTLIGIVLLGLGAAVVRRRRSDYS